MATLGVTTVCAIMSRSGGVATLGVATVCAIMSRSGGVATLGVATVCAIMSRSGGVATLGVATVCAIMSRSGVWLHWVWPQFELLCQGVGVWLLLYRVGLLCCEWVWSAFVTHPICIQISQRDILNSIDREMSSDLREGFKAVGTCHFLLTGIQGPVFLTKIKSCHWLHNRRIESKVHLYLHHLFQGLIDSTRRGHATSIVTAL